GTEIYTATNAKINTEIDPAAHENSGNDKGNNGRAAGYRVLAATIKSVDAATVQVGATANTGLSSGTVADAEMHTANGLLAAQMRAKGEAQAVETMRSSGVSASVSSETPMSSESGFTGGRENGAGGTAGSQTPLAAGRNTALHLDMLTKDWNEKLAQALEQRISGGGKEIDFMLTPKSLGRLRISMSMIEGQLSLAIKTDTAMAAAMLGDAESQLVQMLEARDLRVVSFAASTSGQPGQQNDGASKGDKSSNGEGRSENEDDVEAVEQVSALTADDDGINVTA
ncbi:MAG: flagellar hook-length control protein FliK, partial [Pseudomonadota bacterium]|nr:flagellar hook-length control protein FliK [Pseudomonadota bacterium]